MRLSTGRLVLVVGICILSCDSAPVSQQPHDVLLGTWVLVRVVEVAPTGKITRTADFKRKVGEVKVKFEVVLSNAGGNYTVEIDAEDRQIKGVYKPATFQGKPREIHMSGSGGQEPYLNSGWDFIDHDHLVMTLRISPTNPSFAPSLEDWADIHYDYNHRLEWGLLRE